MSYEDLNVIRVQHCNNPDECLTDLLAQWLREADPQTTWKSLVKALKSTTVDESRVAQEIESTNLVAMDASSNDTESVAAVGNTTTSLSLNIETLSPTKNYIHNESNGIIRKIEGRTDEQKEELELRLRTETEHINLMFHILYNKFFDSLDAQQLPIERLTFHLQGIKVLSQWNQVFHFQVI